MTRLEDADAQFSSRQYGDAQSSFERVAEEALGSGDRETWVEAAVMVARCRLIRGDGTGGLPWLERAATHATPDRPPSWSRFLGVRGRFEWSHHQRLDDAAQTFEQMFRYCRSHEQFDRAIDAAHMLAILAEGERAEHWTRLGIETAEAHGCDGWLGPLWNNLGWAYHERGEHERALESLIQARHWHYQRSDPIAKLAADIFVGMAYRHAGDPASARQEIESAHQTALQMQDAQPDHAGVAERLGNTHEQLAELLVMEGDTTQAADHFTEAVSLYRLAGAAQWGPGEIERVERRLGETAPAD